MLNFLADKIRCLKTCVTHSQPKTVTTKAGSHSPEGHA